MPLAAASAAAWVGVGFRTGFLPGAIVLGTGRFLDMMDKPFSVDCCEALSKLSAMLPGAGELVLLSPILAEASVAALERLMGSSDCSGWSLVGNVSVVGVGAVSLNSANEVPKLDIDRSTRGGALFL